MLMKRIVSLLAIICCTMLAACNNTSVNVKENDDEWGIILRCDDVTPKGMTLKIEQYGGNPSTRLITGAPFWLEKTIDGKWQEHKRIDNNSIGWAADAYVINKNDTREFTIDWERLYGNLAPGKYRLMKEISNVRYGISDDKLYDVIFTIN